jgi:hypothetical protein
MVIELEHSHLAGENIYVSGKFLMGLIVTAIDYTRK